MPHAPPDFTPLVDSTNRSSAGAFTSQMAFSLSTSPFSIFLNHSNLPSFSPAPSHHRAPTQSEGCPARPTGSTNSTFTRESPTHGTNSRTTTFSKSNVCRLCTVTIFVYVVVCIVGAKDCVLPRTVFSVREYEMCITVSGPSVQLNTSPLLISCGQVSQNKNKNKTNSTEVHA